MADPLVDVAELIRRVPEAASSSDRATALLEDASVLARSAGDATWTADTVPAAVIQVVLAVAERAWANPDGIHQESTATYSVIYGNQGGVFLLPEERQAIRKAAGILGVFALGTTGGDIPDTPTALDPLQYPPVADPWETLGVGD